MVATQKVLDSLKQIGLNLYERKLWVALLSRGTSTAGELSSMAKVPHSRTYDVLESLAEKGFVIVQNAKPLRYVAMAPTEALERAKKKIQSNADNMIDQISDLQNSPITKELAKIYKEGVALVEPGELIGSLRGRHAMHNQLETLFKNAKSNVHIMTTVDGLKEISNNHGEILKKAAGRGVKIKIAVPQHKDSEKVFEKINKFAQIKSTSKASLGRFTIVDGNHVVFALTDEKSTHPTQDLSFWAQSSHAAKEILGPMFDAMWEDM